MTLHCNFLFFLFHMCQTKDFQFNNQLKFLMNLNGINAKKSVPECNTISFIQKILKNKYV